MREVDEFARILVVSQNTSCAYFRIALWLLLKVAFSIDVQQLLQDVR